METLAPTKRSCKTSSGLIDEPGFGDNEFSSCSDLDVAERLQLMLGCIERYWRERISDPSFHGTTEQGMVRRVHVALAELWELFETEGMV